MTQGKRIVFTGGSGQAGRHIIPELLKKGYKILNLDLVPLPTPDGSDLNSNVLTLKTDLTDSGQVFNALTTHFSFDSLDTGVLPGLPDAVIHFAAHPRILQVPDNECYRTNVISTYNVIEAASKLGVRKIIIASSETVYGVCFGEGNVPFKHFPVTEDDETHPMDAYGMSKICGEQVARGFARRFGNDIYALRLAGIITPNDYLSPEFRKYFERPETRRRSAWSYVDVRDVAEICHLCIQKDGLGFQAFNAVNNSILSTEPTLTFLGRVAPGIPITRDMREFEAPISNKKVKDVLGFEEKLDWHKRYQASITEGLSNCQKNFP